MKVMLLSLALAMGAVSVMPASAEAGYFNIWFRP